ncbi:MAG: GNAT family N-acetyltransferase [Bacteroidota bacterium]
MNITIRPATTADLPSVYQLVISLAVYEDAEEAVTATLEDYQNDFAEGVFQAHVAEIDSKVVGMVLYYMTYSTWKGKMLYLEDFVVDEQYRRHGIGQLLWDELELEAKRRGCRLLKWQVLDWNEPAIKFYKKNKAIIETEWHNGKIFFEEDM